ncbi:hypothetical protein [Streptomyces sp. KAU_LT]|uniref:hypothetical protein n=1 Tax=Streptomyces sp. KAU_LT TaxID=3046669 RepID=UPI0024B81E46|nr:hypothetical protein [Streptomyces sp. KAU_LT]MDI9830827.1 hypothetical protein [Streptomyces sp. KAU_LT]
MTDGEREMSEDGTTRDGERRACDEEFISMGRDPAVARLLRKQLETLADGRAGAVLAEMAKEVLSGRISLRDAVRVGPYEHELLAVADRFGRQWDEMSELDRSQAESEGARVLNQQREEIHEEERRGRADDRAGRGPSTRHSARGWSVY